MLFCYINACKLWILLSFTLKQVFLYNLKLKHTLEQPTLEVLIHFGAFFSSSFDKPADQYTQNFC